MTDKHTTDSKEIDINFEEACQNHCYIQTEDFHECSLQSVMGHKFYREKAFARQLTQKEFQRDLLGTSSLMNSTSTNGYQQVCQ